MYSFLVSFVFLFLRVASGEPLRDRHLGRVTARLRGTDANGAVAFGGSDTGRFEHTIRGLGLSAALTGRERRSR